MQELKKLLAAECQRQFDIDIEPQLEIPDRKFGDYATNLPLQVAAKTGKDPKAIAESLAKVLKKLPQISEVKVAGPGFINFFLSDKAILDSLEQGPLLHYKGQTVVVEYSDPNPFKVLHVGHLYTSVVGDAIAKILEAAGAKVARVNFGGDVGLHVAKTMWAVRQRLGGEYPEKLTKMAEKTGPDWLAEAYAEGNRAYEEDTKAKEQIRELNERIYTLHDEKDEDSNLAKIYWLTRKWSYKCFETFYGMIGTHFDRFYPESETAGLGLKVVRENIGKVFEESEGAIIFKGEVHNMHTRVFINSQNLPTYETKDIGLALKKWQDYHYDRSIIITGNDIYEYMQVVLKALEQIEPELAKKTVHITHGLVKATGGIKMSSRLGNIIRAEDVLSAADKANTKANKQQNSDVALGAVKYAFLKQRIGADIIFNPDESVSLQGNSGPYLQYAYVRAHSILKKSNNTTKPHPLAASLENEERSLARKISEYQEVVTKATDELMPHHICTYLYELAQTFNRFYETNRIIDDPRQPIRLKLVGAYSKVLKNGLELLNIPVLERM
ncbi:MAG: arginine--tRNA ligase [Candidatus Saccharimonadales bacterium]